MTVYDSLRSIGLSVEVSDSIAPILERYPENKRLAFIYWASGMTIREASKEAGIDRGQLWYMIKLIKGRAIL